MEVDDLLATIDRLGMPLIVKTLDGFGPQHVFVLRDAGDLETLWALADLVADGAGIYGLGVAAQGRTVAERHADGCDTMSADGRTVLLGVDVKLIHPLPSLAIRGRCLTTNARQYLMLDTRRACDTSFQIILAAAFYAAPRNTFRAASGCRRPYSQPLSVGSGIR